MPAALCYLLAAEAASSPADNFGPDARDARPVDAVVERLRALLPGLRVRYGQAPGPAEAPRLTLDCARARAELGWRPAWDLDEALTRTVEWYEAADPQTCRAAQIDAYTAARVVALR